MGLPFFSPLTASAKHPTKAAASRSDIAAGAVLKSQRNSDKRANSR